MQRSTLARKRNAGSVEDIRKRLWGTIERLCALSDAATDQGDTELFLRATNALLQASSVYARISQAAAVEARVSRLEVVYANGRPLGVDEARAELAKSLGLDPDELPAG